jgi:membrane-associated phospholipid phosphatase
MTGAAVTDVPEISEDWYHHVVEFADRTPTPVHWFAVHFTEGAILLLGALLVLAALSRLIGGDLRDRALALAAPVAVVLAYGASEGLKSVVAEDRPCRGPAGLVILADHCPAVGDWSFPSNHATIAGALAATTLLLHRRIGLAGVPLALLAAFSRVFVGVHYPHDVAIGLLLGALVGTLLTPLAARPLAAVLGRLFPAPPPPSPHPPATGSGRPAGRARVIHSVTAEPGRPTRAAPRHPVPPIDQQPRAAGDPERRSVRGWREGG